MRASEILRKLADVIDSAEGSAEQPEQEQPQLQAVEVEVDSNDEQQAGKFVPPLQQKLEILKKSVGMDSIYGADEDLGRMKQMAGLGPAQQEAADDEPLDQ